MRKRAMAIAMVAASVLVLGAVAQAAEIRVLASNGVKAPMEALEHEFEKATGDTLSIEFSTAATLRERIEKGEAFDVAILTDEAVDALIKSAHLSPVMRAKLAAVGIGVGYRTGAAKPDVRTAASIKQALLHAKSITYTGNGATRPAIDKMMVSLGIAKEMEPKTRLVAAGVAPGAVAKGESDLVITLVSEILPEPGIELAGPLPSDLQSYTSFSAAAGSKSGKTPAAQALIKFLDGPAGAATFKAKGMEVR